MKLADHFCHLTENHLDNLKARTKTKIPSWMDTRGALIALLVVMSINAAILLIGESGKATSSCKSAYLLGVADAARVVQDAGGDYKKIYDTTIEMRRKEKPTVIEGL